MTGLAKMLTYFRALLLLSLIELHLRFTPPSQAVKVICSLGHHMFCLSPEEI